MSWDPAERPMRNGRGWIGVRWSEPSSPGGLSSTQVPTATAAARASATSLRMSADSVGENSCVSWRFLKIGISVPESMLPL